MVKFGFAFLFSASLVQAQTGPSAAQLPSFDRLMTSLMATYNIPAGSIALTRNGKLVYSHGYGAAQSGSLFRIASLSKAITAVAILHLVEEGKLSLAQPAFALLPGLPAPAGSQPDKRLATITIRHLLNHSGGWDRSPTGANFDPMFLSPKISRELDVPAPVSAENIIRWMRAQPLQFTPGTRYAYSNFGYAVLGRIIERITGMTYEDYVRAHVLAPMGITGMRIGRTLRAGRLPNEVEYKSPGNARSVFPDVPGMVPWPYGGWHLEAMDAHGGWVASAADYARFVNAIDGRGGKRFLSATSVAELTARPASVAEWKDSKLWYGFGFNINTVGNWWHSGSLDGTATYVIRTHDGFAWVVFFNSRGDSAAAGKDLFRDIDRGLWQASREVAELLRSPGDFRSGQAVSPNAT